LDKAKEREEGGKGGEGEGEGGEAEAEGGEAEGEGEERRRRLRELRRRLQEAEAEGEGEGGEEGEDPDAECDEEPNLETCRTQFNFLSEAKTTYLLGIEADIEVKNVMRELFESNEEAYKEFVNRQFEQF
jgi:hypothetical protein